MRGTSISATPHRSRRTRRRFAVAVSAGLFAALIGSGAATASPSLTARSSSGPYRVEIVSSVTGVGGSYQAVDGFESAIDRINAQGGINGHRLAYSVLDDQSSPTVSASVGQQAVEAKPVAILDGSTSTYYTPRLPVYEAAKIPVFAASAIGFEPFIYTYNGTVEQSAAEVVNGAAAALGGSVKGKKIASVAIASPLGQGILAAATKLVARDGGQMVSTQTLAIGAPSFPGAAQMVASGAQAIVLNSIASGAVVEAKALVAAGFKGRIVVNYTAADNGTLSAIGINNVLALRTINFPVPGTLMYQTAKKYNLTAGTTGGGLLFSVGWSLAYEFAAGLKACDAYPCSPSALVKATNSLGYFTIPGNVALGPTIVTEKIHNALTAGRLYVWNESDAKASPYGDPVSVGPPAYAVGS